MLFGKSIGCIACLCSLHGFSTGVRRGKAFDAFPVIARDGVRVAAGAAEIALVASSDQRLNVGTAIAAHPRCTLCRNEHAPMGFASSLSAAIAPSAE